MAIDRISGPKQPPVAPDNLEADATAAGAVDKGCTDAIRGAGSVQSGAAGEAVDSAQTGPTQAVRSGETSLESYLETHLDRAVAHLEPELAPDQYALVREELERQLQSDPVLRQLVLQASGQLPSGGD